MAPPPFEVEVYQDPEPGSFVLDRFLPPKQKSKEEREAEALASAAARLRLEVRTRQAEAILLALGGASEAVQLYRDILESTDGGLAGSNPRLAEALQAAESVAAARGLVSAAEAAVNLRMKAADALLRIAGLTGAAAGGGSAGGLLPRVAADADAADDARAEAHGGSSAHRGAQDALEELLLQASDEAKARLAERMKRT